MFKYTFLVIVLSFLSSPVVWAESKQNSRTSRDLPSGTHEGRGRKKVEDFQRSSNGGRSAYELGSRHVSACASSLSGEDFSEERGDNSDLF